MRLFAQRKRFTPGPEPLSFAPCQGFGKGQGLKVDPALKCWIGNLAEGTSWKALQDHMNQAGPAVCRSLKGSWLVAV